MKNQYDRRKFLQQSMAAGAAAALSSVPFVSTLFAHPSPPHIDISVANGLDYYANTAKAVKALGGMEAFVRKGNTVGLLINSPFGKHGAHVNPVIALAVLKMCLDAGAKEIYSIEGASESFWKGNALSKSYKKEIAGIKSSDAMTTVKIAKGKALKEAEISQTLLHCDTLINIPIVKN